MLLLLLLPRFEALLVLVLCIPHPPTSRSLSYTPVSTLPIPRLPSYYSLTHGGYCLSRSATHCPTCLPSPPFVHPSLPPPPPDHSLVPICLFSPPLCRPFCPPSSQMGYDLSPTELDDIFARFKNVAEKKKVGLVGMGVSLG